MSDQVKFERGQVVQIVQSVLSKVDGLSAEALNHLHRELLSLEGAIEKTRGDIASGVNTSEAKDELDAVVVATKEATDTIMSACEALEAFADGQDEAVQLAVRAQVTRIYEACSFQDITGQRIAKVIGLLHVVQDKVGNMLQTLNHETPPNADISDADLLNGPQLPVNALSQDDIDKLLADFD